MENASKKNLPEIIQEGRKYVVVIKCDNGVGSGFFIAPNMIATNYHVLEGATKAKVFFDDGRRIKVIGLLAKEEDRDVVILEVAPLGHSLSLLDGFPDQGEKVVAIGHPENLKYTASQGIVSAVRAANEMRSIYSGWDMSGTWIQTDASISKGSSGGPLLNELGLVVGMSTAGHLGGSDLNHAISSIDLQAVLSTAKISRPESLKKVIPFYSSSRGERGGEFFGVDESNFVDSHIRDLLSSASKNLFPILRKEKYVEIQEFLGISTDPYDRLNFLFKNGIVSTKFDHNAIIYIDGEYQCLDVGALGAVYDIESHKCLILDRTRGSSLSRTRLEISFEGVFAVFNPTSYQVSNGALFVTPMQPIQERKHAQWFDAMDEFSEKAVEECQAFEQKREKDIYLWMKVLAYPVSFILLEMLGMPTWVTVVLLSIIFVFHVYYELFYSHDESN